jgi:dTDP-4-dehydrorhamnose reductase
MRLVMVLGASGMLGHQVAYRLSRESEVVGTVRENAGVWQQLPWFRQVRLIGGVSVEDFMTLEAALLQERPSVVANCIGLVKQRREAAEPIPAITINALFPHRLAALCRQIGARLIHFSTDCVFSGRQGPYSEVDQPDPTDLYGRTKLLGEVSGPNCLCLRTSIIGRELRGRAGLIEWFLAQRGRRIKGFTNALYSGLTTPTLADLIARLIAEQPALDGIWHVGADPISKHDLLVLANETFGNNVEIERDDTFYCDRRLDSSHFRSATGFRPPSWQAMVQALHAVSSWYE